MMEVGKGDGIFSVCIRAIHEARATRAPVRFVFNGVELCATMLSNAGDLVHEYRTVLDCERRARNQTLAGQLLRAAGIVEGAHPEAAEYLRNEARRLTDGD